MRYLFLTLATLGSTLSAPALAQEATNWTGPYVGISAGLDFQNGDDNSGQRFDTNLDGNFSDTVRTGAGVNAFGPGFCGGRPAGPMAAQGCGRDSDRTGYAGHLGYDLQFGGIVVGAVGEFGQTKIHDANTSFSTTPASYTMSRSLDYSGTIRGRAGLAIGSVLPYVTGGAAYGRIKRSFSSTNTANAFTVDDRRSFEWGYAVGGGLETKVARNFSIGVLYLYNNIKDEDSSVTVGRGSAPLTNPFLLVNPQGTRIRRNDEQFDWHSARVTASLRF